MRALVLGASGATGKHLVGQLLEMGHEVKVIVRPTSLIPMEWEEDERVSVIKDHVHQMTPEEMARHLEDCAAVASCLGHNLTWKGIFGEPRKLVRDSIRVVCDAITTSSPSEAKKVILMNTVGHRNRDLDEKVSLGERIVIGLIRLLIPPQSDNEAAAEYLRLDIGQANPDVHWVAVRPDSLIDEDKVSSYEVHPSPLRSAIFDSGKTSRINVGHFMAKLIVDEVVWSSWKGQMPVIYNQVS